MGSSEGLENLRKRIDEIDKRIIELLNERGRIAIEISRLKQENSFNVYDPAREREIERNIRNTNPGPLSTDSVVSVFREIISGCRSLQHPIRVAYLGPQGSFSHQASFHEFGSSADLVPVGSFEDVFEEVERERASFGVVPIENSVEGSVGSVLDMFVTSDLKVSSEFYERVGHFLLAKTEDIGNIEVVASHPQALGQCKRWLSRNLKNVEVRETASTARAAQLASRDRKIAAIAGELAASIYRLKVLERHIEDNPQNTTRFWVIGRQYGRPTGADKTSIVFSLRDEPAALQRALLPFAEARINLTRIESRPSKGRSWEYVFFVDFEGHSDSEGIRGVLSRVEKNCIFLKILGSYPKGRG
ncbi:MAG TPA: prephenate dehydratase [Thermodesulfobacteriota bacterium]|nr:prephenate dehydratase [Thermodesulfobacteriota bacterium]